MPGVVHAIDSYARTVAIMRNAAIIGLIVLIAIIVIRKRKKD